MRLSATHNMTSEFLANRYTSVDVGTGVIAYFSDNLQLNFVMEALIEKIKRDGAILTLKALEA